jgi:hypothetical protein
MQIERDGRMIRVRPLDALSVQAEDGWLVMEQKTALELAQALAEARALDQMENEGEDG